MEENRLRNKSEYSKSSLDLPVLIYVLKWTGSRKRPLTVPEIVTEIQYILGETYSKRTLQRRMNMLEEATDWEKETIADLKQKKLLYNTQSIFGKLYRFYMEDFLITCQGPRRKYLPTA
ncbi:MAG: hypothetical protein J6O55_01410 [Lachnospiraceae bacterium]|nr:hypothetical protein [Lachnospiraceae bacterium]